MSAEDQATRGFTQIILDRIGHPFIGSFIFTFVITNYDILIDLFVNIRDPDAVLIFNSFLYSEWKTRLGVPFGMMLAFPILIQNGSDIVYTYFKEKTNTYIENRKEKEKLEIHLNKIENLKNQLYNQKDLNNQIVKQTCDIIQTTLNLVKNRDNIFHLQVFESNEVLEKGDFVSYLIDLGKIVFYDKNIMFLGRVFYKINDTLYIIECLDSGKLKELLKEMLNEKINSLPYHETFIKVNRKGDFELLERNNFTNHVIASKLKNHHDYKILNEGKSNNEILKESRMYLEVLLKRKTPKNFVYKNRWYYFKALICGKESEE